MKRIKLFEEYVSSNVDKLLDKINDKGMDSLTAQELEILKNSGVIPKEEKDENNLIAKSDIDNMAESEDIEGVDSEWLERRNKARELYDFDVSNYASIKRHYDKIIDYINDEENADVFKSNIIKSFLDKIDNELEINDSKVFKMYNNLMDILDTIYSKYGNNEDEEDEDED
jgi:hypothetical protein